MEIMGQPFLVILDDAVKRGTLPGKPACGGC